MIGVFASHRTKGPSSAPLEPALPRPALFYFGRFGFLAPTASKEIFPPRRRTFRPPGNWHRLGVAASAGIGTNRSSTALLNSSGGEPATMSHRRAAARARIGGRDSKARVGNMFGRIGEAASVQSFNSRQGGGSCSSDSVNSGRVSKILRKRLRR